MMQALLVASLLFNASLLYKVEFDEIDETNNCTTYECHAYEDFLEEWHRYDEEKQELEMQGQDAPEFEYQIPEEKYDGPLEEV